MSADTDRLAEAWREAATTLWTYANRTSDGSWARNLPHLRADMGQVLRAFRASLPEDFAGWTPAVDRHLADRQIKSASGLPDPEKVTAGKCLRMGYAVAVADPSCLLPSESAFLARIGLGDRLPPKRPKEVAVDGGNGFTVGFAFAYPGLTPEGRRTRKWTAATSVATVERVPPDEAPVRWRLPRPGGGHLEVREYGGAYFRPILAPGSWEPCTEGAFASACGGEDAWRDDPFAPRRPGPTVAMTEYGRWSEDDAADGTRDAEAAECLGRAGRLLSVDGIVHVRTGAPAYGPALLGRYVHTMRVALGWRLDGLTSLDDQSPLVSVNFDDVTDWGCGRTWDLLFGEDDPTTDGFAAFPPAAYDAALEIARRVADYAGIPFVETGTPGRSEDPNPCDPRGAVLDAIGRQPRGPRWRDQESDPRYSVVEGIRDWAAGSPEGATEADACESLTSLLSLTSRLSSNPTDVMMDRLHYGTAKATGEVAAMALRGAFDPKEEADDTEFLSFVP